MPASAPLTPEFRENYILGGRAVFTLVSLRSKARFTYRVVAKEVVDAAKAGDDETNIDIPKKTLRFVSLLNGPDNTRDYTFLGTIFPSGDYRHGNKSKVSPEAASAKAFVWFWDHMESDQVEVWHEGVCSRCGRPLTDPESVQRGLGPICFERMVGG